MARDHRISIKDVAREADVSVTTVSHALNNKGRLNPDTRKRVRDVAERLGYKPNPAARSLVSGKTGLIAVIPSLPQQTRVSFSDVGYFTALIGAATADAAVRSAELASEAGGCAGHGPRTIGEVGDPGETDGRDGSAATHGVGGLFERTEPPGAVYVLRDGVGVELLRRIVHMRLAVLVD